MCVLCYPIASFSFELDAAKNHYIPPTIIIERHIYQNTEFNLKLRMERRGENKYVAII